MPKRERITLTEIEHDIVRNIGTSERETEAKYNSKRKWKLLDYVLLVALALLLIFFPKATTVFLFTMPVIIAVYIFALILIKHRRKKNVRIEDYCVGVGVLSHVTEEHYERTNYRRGHRHTVTVNNYALHFDGGESFLLPHDNYTWSRENPMSDEFICKNSHKGDGFIVVKRRDSGEIATVYHKDFFEYKENRY